MDTVEDDLFFNRVGLPNADHTNWREKAAELIGEDEVEFKGFRVEEGKFPIVTITAKTKEELDVVFARAIELSDAS